MRTTKKDDAPQENGAIAESTMHCDDIPRDDEATLDRVAEALAAARILSLPARGMNDRFFIRSAEVRRRLGYSARELDEAMASGLAPRPIYTANGQRRWRRLEVDMYAVVAPFDRWVLADPHAMQLVRSRGWRAGSVAR